jgi:predicted deacylase
MTGRTIIRPNEFDAGTYPLESRHRLDVHVSASPDGVPVTIPVVLLAGQARRPRVALVAGVHGDEYEGPRALAELATELMPERLAGTLLIIPVANRPAYNGGTRTSPIDGLNLARVFPGNPEGFLSERLAYHLFHHVLAGVDHIADLHSAGTKYLHMPLAGFYDVAGPVGAASRAAARAWGFEHLWSMETWFTSCVPLALASSRVSARSAPSTRANGPCVCFRRVEERWS